MNLSLRAARIAFISFVKAHLISEVTTHLNIKEILPYSPLRLKEQRVNYLIIFISLSKFSTWGFPLISHHMKLKNIYYLLCVLNFESILNFWNGRVYNFLSSLLKKQHCYCCCFIVCLVPGLNWLLLESIILHKSQNEKKLLVYFGLIERNKQLPISLFLIPFLCSFI